jgi:hypothetical protein
VVPADVDPSKERDRDHGRTARVAWGLPALKENVGESLDPGAKMRGTISAILLNMGNPLCRSALTLWCASSR